MGKKFILKAACAILAGAAIFGTLKFFQNSGGDSEDFEKCVSLDGDAWTLSFFPQPASGALRTPLKIKAAEKISINARVPGNVYLDMLAAGLIDNPEIGDNSYALRKYEGHQWVYERRFPSPELKDGQSAILKFGGIDCFADIYLNGEKIGESGNFFMEYAFDISEKLSGKGDNSLQVVIRSPIMEAAKFSYGVHGHFDINGSDGEYVRRPAHSYGWDIFPRIVGAGLWRGVQIEIRNPVHIEDTHWFLTGRNGNNLSFSLDVKLSAPFDVLDSAKLRVRLAKDGKTVFEKLEPLYAMSQRLKYTNQALEVWWPRGYGKPALYDAEVSVVDAGGKTLATEKRRIGFRRVELEFENIVPPDKKGKFLFKVNGEPIFVRGTNWIPLDSMHSRIENRYPDALKMLADLNCNMVRVWEGGIYESDTFYKFCDENGIMVWQDFCMGCTQYPQSDAFVKTVEAEAEQVVKKLRNHPCISLWSGNNENDIAMNWQHRFYNFDPNKDRISREVLPRVLFEFDPFVPYLPSSPYIDQNAYDNPKTTFRPEDHLWRCDGYYKIPFFTQAKALFTSEIGYHGLPNLGSLRRMFDKDFVKPFEADGKTFNAQWKAKAVNVFKNVQNPFLLDRLKKFTKESRALFGEVPEKLEDFVLATQSAQGEALKYFVELFRARKFDKTGIMLWNLRDGWPVLSDAITDFYNSKKLAYDFIKRVQTDVLVLVTDGGELVGVNDTLLEKSLEAKVRDLDSGKILFNGAFKIPANGKIVASKFPMPHGQGMLEISYKTQGSTAKNHYLYGTPPFDLRKYAKWLEELGFETDRK